MTLTLAVADQPYTRALLSGRIPIEGVDARFVKVEPLVAAYRRMVREVAFDVCELSATTYIVARAHGAPFIALPIFLSRGFHHGALLVRPDAGIRTPKDLEGRKVGVRAYSVTTGVWTRGLLADEYGLDASKVTWVVDDEEHVQSLKLPPNVVHAPEGRSLVEMMATGEISAGFSGNAGLGRTGKPTAGWNDGKAPAGDYPPLLPNATQLDVAAYRATGIYPLHGTIVVKDSVLAEHPWVARSLHDALGRAKAAWLAEGLDAKHQALAAIVGPDPLPFGIDANRASLEALERYAFAQRLTPRRFDIEQLFA